MVYPGQRVSFPMSENPMFEFVGAHSIHTRHQSHKMDTEFDKFKEAHSRQYGSAREEEQRKFSQVYDSS